MTPFQKIIQIFPFRLNSAVFLLFEKYAKSQPVSDMSVTWYLKISILIFVYFCLQRKSEYTGNLHKMTKPNKSYPNMKPKYRLTILTLILNYFWKGLNSEFLKSQNYQPKSTLTLRNLKLIDEISVTVPLL